MQQQTQKKSRTKKKKKPETNLNGPSAIKIHPGEIQIK